MIEPTSKQGKENVCSDQYSGRNARTLRQLPGEFHTVPQPCGQRLGNVVHRPVESLWTKGVRRLCPFGGILLGGLVLGGRVLVGDRLFDRDRRLLLLGRGGLGLGSRLRLLGRLERRELLLGRELLALRCDDELDLGDDVGEHLERHGVPADPLDRVHLELAAVDAELLLLPEPVGDVRRGDRAEERSRRAGVHVEAKLDALDALRDRLCLVGRLRLVPRTLGVALLELLDEPGRRDLREPAGQQEVARVPAGDVHHVAAQAELVDVLLEDDFHGYLSPTYGRSAISRARFTATATWR